MVKAVVVESGVRQQLRAQLSFKSVPQASNTESVATFRPREAKEDRKMSASQDQSQQNVTVGNTDR